MSSLINLFRFFLSNKNQIIRHTTKMASTSSSNILVRDLLNNKTSNDQFLCRCEMEEPKPIGGFEFYRGAETHLVLPFYNESRWEIIKNSLEWIANNGRTMTFSQFKDCCSAYIQTTTELDFSALEALINSNWRRGTVLNELLPQIAKLALDLPKQIPQPIRLLRAHQNGSLTLSQRQAASLLANAFYSTFPTGDSVRRTKYNRSNFLNLFKGKRKAVQKLKCILHYFSQFLQSSPYGTLSFIRQRVSTEPDWANSNSPLCALNVMATGKIEDAGEQMTQLDFANAFIGGGVLGYGLVQEEIRFLICPELIVSCLIVEELEPDEALLMIGAERYSDYDGYDRTFKWLHRKRSQSPPRDGLKRAKCELLAIDALSYSGTRVQFREQYIRRELLKAFAGFSLQDGTSPRAIATGNWGCGAFGGDLHLKSMIQLIAASMVERPLNYFTFGGKLFAQKLEETVRNLSQNHVTIGILYKMLIAYGLGENVQSQQLFNWINEQLMDHPNRSQSVEAPNLEMEATITETD